MFNSVNILNNSRVKNNFWGLCRWQELISRHLYDLLPQWMLEVKINWQEHTIFFISHKLQTFESKENEYALQDARAHDVFRPMS